MNKLWTSLLVACPLVVIQRRRLIASQFDRWDPGYEIHPSYVTLVILRAGDADNPVAGWQLKCVPGPLGRDFWVVDHTVSLSFLSAFGDRQFNSVRTVKPDSSALAL